MTIKIQIYLLTVILVIKKLIKLILKIFGSLLTMTKEYVCLSA